MHDCSLVSSLPLSVLTKLQVMCYQLFCQCSGLKLLIVSIADNRGTNRPSQWCHWKEVTLKWVQFAPGIKWVSLTYVTGLPLKKCNQQQCVPSRPEALILTRAWVRGTVTPVWQELCHYTWRREWWKKLNLSADIFFFIYILGVSR